TGREDFGHDVVYPCKSTRFSFRPFGHIISMDRVLGAVGVNYRYKYKTDGDSLINLIHNGNFQTSAIIPPIFGGVDELTFAPDEWQRRRNVSQLPGFPIPRMELLPAGTAPMPAIPDGPPDIFTYLRMDGIYHNRQWLTSYSG